MNTKIRKALFLRPRFIVTLTVLLALLLVVSALFELNQIRKEIYHIMTEEAVSLIESIAISSDNTTLAFSEVESQIADRLLNNARLIGRMYEAKPLNLSELARLADENHLFRINIFDAQGNKVASNQSSQHNHNTVPERHHPVDFIKPLLEGLQDELVIGFKIARFFDGNRYAAAVRRAGGGAVVVNIDAKEMLQLRREIGIGRLINDIAAQDGIVYVAIQDTVGLIAASRNITGLDDIAGDEFLNEIYSGDSPATRLITMDEETVFEAVSPFILDEQLIGLLRIGLKTDHITEANARTRRRVVLISVLLLVAGTLAFSYVVINQNYATLDEAYLRTKTYTGNILENMNDVLIAVDKDCNVTLLNQAAEKMFGDHASTIVGKQYQVLFEDGGLLAETLSKGKGIYNREQKVRIKDRTATLVINTFVLKDDAGDVDSAVAVIKDVTRERVLQENLKRQDKLAAMGKLASGVAHEVRNPLNAIGMIGQRIRNEFQPESDIPEYNNLTKTVVTEVKRINDIIQRFLRFARPPVLSIEQNDLSGLLQEVGQLVKAEAEAEGIAIKMELLPDCLVPCDRNQMKQVFLNVIQNALQACEKGEQVTIRLLQTDTFLVTEVMDTGSGIPESDLSRVFDLYYTTKASGTGMGLSIANQIVNAHGGRIEVESEVGQGTTLRILLHDGKTESEMA